MPAESQPREPFLQQSLKLLGVAALFAVCAAFSAVLIGLTDWLLTPEPPPGVLFVLRGRAGTYLLPLAAGGIPFALLCVALFLRSRRAGISVVLNAAVWPGAYYLMFISGHWAFRTFGETGYRKGELVIFALAGALGAVGVTLADAIVCRRLFSPSCLAIAALLGAMGVCLARLPFDVSLYNAYNAFEELATVVVWQAFVGTYFYWECAENRKRA